MQLLTPGQETHMNIRRKPSTDGQPGDLLFVVLVSMFTTHVSLTFAGHHILNKALPVAEARAYLQYLMDEAAAGTQMWLLIERAGHWTTAMAMVDQAERDLIDSINQTLDAVTADRDTTQLTEDAQQIVGDGQGWNAFKQQARRDFTRTRVNTQPPTRAMLDLIRTHQGGVVKARPGQTWAVLKGLYARIGGTKVYRPGTHVIRELHYDPAFLDAIIAEHDNVRVEERAA